MALDFAGREILLAAPVNRNLSMIDGFDTAAGETKDYLYLCIEYDERTVSPSLNITGTSSLEGEGEADRIKESCHLYLTEEEPNRYELEPESMYRQEALLYEQDQIFVRQMIPAAAASGEEFGFPGVYGRADRAFCRCGAGIPDGGKGTDSGVPPEGAPHLFLPCHGP